MPAVTPDGSHSGVKVCILSCTLHMVTLQKPHLPHSFQARSSHAWQHNNAVTVFCRMEVCGPVRQKPAILAIHLLGPKDAQTQIQRRPLASCQSNGTCPTPRATFPEVTIQNTPALLTRTRPGQRGHSTPPRPSRLRRHARKYSVLNLGTTAVAAALSRALRLRLCQLVRRDVPRAPSPPSTRRISVG